MHSQPITVILISGFMLDETLWDDLLPRLPKHWHTRPTAIPQGDSIAEIANTIQSNAPEKFVLVGFSLGGYIARAIAERFPENVMALILITTSLRPDSRASRERKLHAIEVMKKDGFKGVKKSAIKRAFHPDNQSNAEFINKAHKMSLHLGFEAFVQQALLDRPLPAKSHIQCPTLVIAGLQDNIRSVVESQELVDYIPNAQLKIIEDTGHMIPMEQPQALANVMIDWLENSLDNSVA